MPAEEGGEARLAALEEIARGKREEAREEQEDDQEDVRDRRREVGGELDEVFRRLTLPDTVKR